MPKGSRAVLLVAGAGLVVAWLAAAADRQPVATTGAADSRQDAAGLARAEHLAQEIQSQATRLRAHLAAAPQPTISERNPFTFEAGAGRVPRRDQVRAATAERALDGGLAGSVADLPPITLSGIAENPSDAAESAAPVRIAVLSGYGDVFLAKVGETIASRYEVTAIGADAVEIRDLFTGRTIRLGLR